jgi:hypothetical protein
MKKNQFALMRIAGLVILLVFPFLSAVDMLFPGCSQSAKAIAEEEYPVLHVQQPNPFYRPDAEFIVITDPEGRVMTVWEHGARIELSEVKGSVIMLRGDDVTIRLLEEGQPVKAGDRVELSFSVDGEVIRVGTWRVSAVREDGTVDAELFDRRGEPSIGMDAQVFIQADRSAALQEIKPSAERQEKTDRQQPAQTAQDKKSVVKEAEPTSIEEALALYSRTAVPIDYSNYGNSQPCESGTIRFHPERIEMAVSGKSDWEKCIFKVSDDFFENFLASFYVTVDTKSHHSFHVGIVYGNKPGDDQKIDFVRAGILAFSGKRSSGLFKSDWRYSTDLMAHYPAKEGKRGYISESLPGDTIPTPGILTLMKTGSRFRLYWNAKEMGTWKEETIFNGHVWLEFMAHGRGSIIATFKDISIDHLH